MTDFSISYKVNGFEQFDSCITNSMHSWAIRQDLSDLHIDTKRIEPYLVEDVGAFINLIDTLNYSYKSPVFYRAHTNVNYLNVPSVFREKTYLNNEHWVFREFQRRMPQAFERCSNTLEKLVVMQHYGCFSRCLDVTESPLIALAFACIDEKKNPNIYEDWRKDPKNRFSCISLFQANSENGDIKTYDSKTAAVIANCALCKNTFTYGYLDILLRGDGLMAGKENFTYFRDIIKRSIIVRTKQDNPRIRNQQGAFILCNANELTSIDLNKKCRVDEFNDFFLNKKDDPKIPINYQRLLNNPRKVFKTKLHNPSEWGFKFEKHVPYYTKKEGDEITNLDPFDIERLYLKRGNKRVVIFISPMAKRKIVKQLEKLGITYDYLYPEVDTVFSKIVNIAKDNTINTLGRD